MPLTMMAPGKTESIKRITGKDDVRQHLHNLGFVPGETVTVVNQIAGNMILCIKGTRIALDDRMAGRILI